MITYQTGSLPLAVITAIICGCFGISLYDACYKAFVRKNKAKSLNKDMTILGFIFGAVIMCCVVGYGCVYYDHFQELIEANKEFNQMQREEHTDSGMVNIFDWYEAYIIASDWSSSVNV